MSNLTNIDAQVLAGTVALKRGDLVTSLGNLCRANMLLGMLALEAEPAGFSEASVLVAELQLAFSEAIQPSGVPWDERHSQGQCDRQDQENRR